MWAREGEEGSRAERGRSWASGCLGWESALVAASPLLCESRCGLWYSTPRSACPSHSVASPPAPLPCEKIVDKINERKKAQTLVGFIDQIFDKALIEVTFAQLYANLVAA